MGTVYSNFNGNTVVKTEDVIEKEKEYVQYIINHINNVYRAFLSIFYSCKQYIPNGYTAEEYKEAIDKVKIDIVDHDRSKFSDEEFHPYRVKFFPTLAEKQKMEEDIEFLNKVKDDFEEAWKHHYQNNDHHTKYYLIPEHDGIDAHYNDMPLYAIIHMICDWCAMSLYFNDDMTTVIDWYNKDAEDEKSEMTEKTKATVEELLQKIFGENQN